MSLLSAIGTGMRRNPYPLYTLMRRVRPVFHDRMHNIWLLFDYDSVKRALFDPASFSSAVKSPGGGGVPDWMIFHDDPRHARLRGIVAKAFTPRFVSALEPRVRELSTSLLDALVSRGRMDLITEFAEPLPTLVMAELLGIAPDDRSTFTRWAHAILNLGYAVTGGERAAQSVREYRLVSAEMEVYLTDTLADRRAHPREDLLARMVQAEVDGEQLSDTEIFLFVQLLLSAGTETTTNALGSAIATLLDNPVELARLRAEPALMPRAIEEVLRFRSPLQMAFRTTRCEVTLHGCRIPAGALVLPVIGSANRDERHFPRAHCFEIMREETPHIAFGHGIHFCIGAALARLELRVALPDLLTRLPQLTRVTRRWDPRDALIVHGAKRLELRFSPAASAAAANCSTS